MTGQELKKKISQQNVSALAIAKKMGISPQALNSTFNAADVKSGTLERIADTLGVGMSFFYPADTQSAVASGNSSIAVNNITGNIEAGDCAALIEKVKLLEQLLEERERVIEEKERTIKILMQK